MRPSCRNSECLIGYVVAAIRLAHQLRQLGDIRRDAPGLVLVSKLAAERRPGLISRNIRRRAQWPLLSLTMKQEAFASSMSHGGGKRRDTAT